MQKEENIFATIQTIKKNSRIFLYGPRGRLVPSSSLLVKYNSCEGVYSSNKGTVLQAILDASYIQVTCVKGIHLDNPTKVQTLSAIFIGTHLNPMTQVHLNWYLQIVVVFLERVSPPQIGA
jgi:hypothetical protein